MKLAKIHVKPSKLDKRLNAEDMKDLQKKISGRSVYSNLNALYIRKPKHSKVRYQY